MLLPSHLFVALVLALLCIRLLNSKLYVLSYFIAVLWFASMEMQVINSIRSWDKRVEVYDRIVPILDEENALDYIFVEVPYFLNSNYNNEPVFSLIEDFQGGLILKDYSGDSEQVFPFTSKMLSDSLYWSNHNILNVIRINQIDRFSCLYSTIKSTYSSDSIVYYNRGVASLPTSNYFANQTECKRSEVRSWLSTYFK